MNTLYKALAGLLLSFTVGCASTPANCQEDECWTDMGLYEYCTEVQGFSPGECAVRLMKSRVGE